MNIQKIKTYIGFAKKSNAIIYGIDNIVKSNAHIVIYSDKLSENSTNELLNYAKKKNIQVLKVGADLMNSIVENDSVKAFGIRNSDLASAINNYIQITEETNW